MKPAYMLHADGHAPRRFDSLKKAEEAGDKLMEEDKSVLFYTVITPCGAPMLTESPRINLW